MTQFTNNHKSSLVRTRSIGNFLWRIYSRALPYQQLEFKNKLMLLSDGNEDKLWQSFMRVQTKPEKDEQFNAEIIGTMVQVFCETDIKTKYDLTDLEKLRLKHQRDNQKDNQLSFV